MMTSRDAIVLSALLTTPRTRRILMGGASPSTDEGQVGPDPALLLARMHAAGATLEPELGAATSHAARALGRTEGGDIHVLVLGAPGYPARLAEIPDPPLVLWCRGQTTALGAPAVAIVGSRTGSRYACDVAAELGSALAARGVAVVSGLARGVDAAAHRGALQAGGPTVAVLGCGVEVVYPPEHDRLSRAVMAAGVVVSELTPSAPPLAFHFPRRNRIISGLALAVVVVEANERSGSLITARCAAEQGREVMAVPGNVLTGRCRGGHALIRDGAKVVEDVDDILEEIQPQIGPPSEVSPVRTESDCEEDLLLTHMDRGEAYELDQLASLSGLDPGDLAMRVLELELEGRIVRLAGGRFSRG